MNRWDELGWDGTVWRRRAERMQYDINPTKHSDEAALQCTRNKYNGPHLMGGVSVTCFK